MNITSGTERSAAATPLRVATAPRYRVLVIDNEPAIARVAARILGRAHDLDYCEDASEACDLVRRGQTYSVILCDLLMPKMTGRDFYRHVARFAPDLAERIVFITGAACLASTRAFTGNLPNLMLEKPFTRAALTGVVLHVGRCSTGAAAPYLPWAS